MSTHEQTQLAVELMQVKPILDSIGVDVCGVEQFNLQVPKKQKKPDIHIPDYNGKYIGVEVTECITVDVATNQKWQLQRGNQRLKQILKWVRNKLEQEQRYYNVSLEFSSLTHKLLEGRQYPSNIKEDIFEEIIRHKETDEIRFFGEDYEIRNKLEEEGAFDYKYVMSASFHTEYPPNIMIWQVSSGGIKCIEKEYVISRIADKEQKLSEYRKLNPQMDEFWLCLYVEEMEFRSIKAYPTNTHSSNFDRIYLTTRSECKRIK